MNRLEHDIFNFMRSDKTIFGQRELKILEKVFLYVGMHTIPKHNKYYS